MTNAEIIMRESNELVSKGILAIMDDEPEPIHTYQGWLSLGFKVKKGEHAIAQFPIWTPTKVKWQKDSDDEDEKPKTRVYMKKASWFKGSQVEEVTK